MDKNIELEVIDVIPSQEESDAYVLVLKEVEGERLLPIIISFTEASAIQLFIREKTFPRPLVHDVLINALNFSEINIEKVEIYKVVDGVYYAYLYLKDKRDNRYTRIDARPSDAILMALKSNTPIYIAESILTNEAIEEEAIDAEVTESVDQLEEALNLAIEEENYELASVLRDKIAQLK